MLINLHSHSTCSAFYDDGHPHWGPRRKIDERGFSYLEIGDWTLFLSTPEIEEQISAGRQDEMLAEWRARADDPAWRIAKMDEAGQDIQVLSVPPPLNLYHTGDYGVGHARKCNDVQAEYVAKAPDRFLFWAHIPMQDPVAAAAELERAVKDLGAKGAMIGAANYGGLEPGDDELDVLWAKVTELDVPILVHGTTQSQTWGAASKDERFEYTTTVGYPYDETRFFWNVICGGALDRFPDLKFIITHGGGFVPYQLGRLSVTNQVTKDRRNVRPMDEYLPNFWFDPMIHDLRMRQAMVDVIGPDRLVYGDNFGGSDGIRENLVAPLDLTSADKAKISSENAIELLKLRVSAGAA